MAANVEDNNTQEFDITVGEKDLKFVVTREAYNKLVNNLGPGNKVSAFHNFLVATVTDDNKKALTELLKATPGSEVAIGSSIYEAYTPDLDVTVKKR